MVTYRLTWRQLAAAEGLRSDQSLPDRSLTPAGSMRCNHSISSLGSSDHCAPLEARVSQSETPSGHLQEVGRPLISSLLRLQPDNSPNSWTKHQRDTTAT
ncbi:hypothetical protein NQZ68_024792 [Dissostichus eleginoides]|nr:hypothetical protein NQZ68_024792 [Dissostichus eleginoides]